MTIGRPSDYTPEKAELICEQIASGRSLVAICKADEMPSITSVFRWLAANTLFREQYARAREAQADVLAEETLEIADDSASDYIETEDGPRINPEHVQRSRLRIDARKWYASKVAPKKYGDKLDVDHTGNIVVEVAR